MSVNGSFEKAPTIPVCVWLHGYPLNKKDVLTFKNFKLRH